MGRRKLSPIMVNFTMAQDQKSRLKKLLTIKYRYYNYLRAEVVYLIQ